MRDIYLLIEDDAKRLTEAFLSGELSVDSNQLADIFSAAQIARLSSDIIQYMLEEKIYSLLLPYLSTMKWLELPLAQIYSRRSRNTLLGLIKEGKIYGTKAGGGGWVIERESIDACYNVEKKALKAKLNVIRRKAS